MSCNKLWGYLDVCRGRYLCSEHGSFCDSSDNYQVTCPRCCINANPYKKTAAKVRNNPLDRGLQIMRNLQGRSGRYASIIAGLFASIAALAVISQNADGTSSLQSLNQNFLYVCVAAFAIGLVSLALFIASMAHMPTLDAKTSRFMEKTIGDWEVHVGSYLSWFERLHWWGTVVFCFAIAVFILCGGISIFVLGEPAN